MLATDTQTQGSNVSPSTWNDMISEIINVIEDLGIALDSANDTQLARAFFDYLTLSTWYTGAGSAAAQTLTSVGNIEGAIYGVGMRVFWRPSNASVGGGTTIAVNGQVAKTLLQEDGTAIIANDLIVTKDAEARYDGTNFYLIGA